MDPFGLQDIITSRVLTLAARGDLAGLRSLASSQGLSPAQQALARQAILNIENGVQGAKSSAELAKHIKNLERYRTQLENLRRALQNTKGKKVRDRLQDMINDIVRQNKGHEKEIWQKWPEVAKVLCP